MQSPHSRAASLPCINIPFPRTQLALAGSFGGGAGVTREIKHSRGTGLRGRDQQRKKSSSEQCCALTRVSAPCPSAPRPQRGRKAPCRERGVLWTAHLPHAPRVSAAVLPPTQAGKVAQRGSNFQTLCAFPFMNVTLTAPVAWLNHSSISRGLWYRSKSLHHLSPQWKGSLNTRTCTGTRLELFPLLFFFYVALPCTAITLPYFLQYRVHSFPLPPRPGRA